MRIFDINGPLFAFLNKMADLCILNLLCLLCCLPIFTIGASMAALYSMTLKMVNDQEGYIVRGFFQAFKENFKQATLLWVPSMIALFILIADIRIFGSDANKTYQPLMIGAFFLLFAVLFMLLFAFPIMAKFQNSLSAIIKNSFLMGIGNLPWAVCIILIFAVPPVITAMLPKSLGFIYIFWLLFGISLTAFCASYIFNFKIFARYIEKEPED